MRSASPCVTVYRYTLLRYSRVASSRSNGAGYGVAASSKRFDAATGEALPFAFAQAIDKEVDAAATAAASASGVYRACPSAKQAGFLTAIADEMDALGGDFIKLLTRERRFQRRASKASEAGHLLFKGPWPGMLPEASSETLPRYYWRSATKKCLRLPWPWRGFAYVFIAACPVVTRRSTVNLRRD